MEREKLRQQAHNVLEMLNNNPDALRAGVIWMRDSSDDEIRDMADRLKRLADSPHPIGKYFNRIGSLHKKNQDVDLTNLNTEGLWDSHGRIIEHEE